MSFHPRMPYGSGWHKSERTFAEEGPPFAFTSENHARLEEIATYYPPERRKSAILAALYLVQEQQGYISGHAMEHVAEAIGCTTADVEDVVSYYVMFFTKPTGKYVLQVCRTLSCALRGAERVTEELSKQLHCKVGETDASGTFTMTCSLEADVTCPLKSPKRTSGCEVPSSSMPEYVMTTSPPGNAA